VPVRAFGGSDDPPGFVEADPVADSGPVAKGSFVQTLALTGIATGWTECAARFSLYRDRMTSNDPVPIPRRSIT
jgi:hypothetical protein